MEWDQWIFQRAWRAAARVLERRRRGALPPPADLSAQAAALERLRALVSGTPIGSGDQAFQLASAPLLFAAERNEDFIRLRLCLTTPRASGARNFFQHARAVLAQYPGLRERWLRIQSAWPAERKLNPEHVRGLRLRLQSGFSDAVAARGEETSPAVDGLARATGSPETQVTTERRLTKSDAAETLTPDQKRQEDYTLGHTFEKIETAEEFSGQWRDFDGTDELEEHADAVDEINFRYKIRSNDPAYSALTADSGATLAPESSDAELPGAAYRYDEWNYARRAYRREYCSVFEERPKADASDYAARTLSARRIALCEVQRRILRLADGLEAAPRSSAGEDPDLDAVIDRYADLAARRTPTERIYVSRRRRNIDLTILILLDLSLSTDSWVEGRRILDVEKEATLIFGEALARCGVRFALAGFSSRTRNRCDYLCIKGFTESWNSARHRIGGLKPRGYTRIGPALRHSMALLSRERTRQRWVLLLTDGRPNDYDRYEGRYGIEDVRQAIREGERNAVRVHALAVERRERPALPEMMQNASYRLLWSPERLTEGLTDFFRLAARGH